MMADFQNSSSRRKEDLANKRENEEAAQQAKKKAKLELKLLQVKKQTLMEEKAQEILSIDIKIKQLRSQV